MNRERYEKIKALFLAVREALPAERVKLLDSACESDSCLREEVESLLLEDGGAGERDSRPSSGGSLAAAGTASLLGPVATGMIGSYRLLDVIGEGGMGIVYRAEQRKPRRAVALKIVRPGLASPERLERFEREAEVLGRLHHPGIAQIYEAATADTGSGPQPFFVMELIDGEPLTEYVEKRKMSTEERLELFLKVCDAVEHAHQKGVVHRDLKPANVLVDEYGAPKVLDFGVARTTDMEMTQQVRTETGQIIGTIPYMSPEQIAAEPGEVDSMADVYSLGVICYELLSGRLPFDVKGRTLPEFIRVISEEDPIPLGSGDNAPSGEIDSVVARALEKKKSRRYSSVSEFAEEVRRYLHEDSTGGRLGQTNRHDGSPLTNIPFSRNPYFTGRASVFASLRAALTEQRDATPRRLQAISGLGGIGKTQTAVEYAYRHASDYDAILWVRAESRDEIVSSLGEIARVLDLPSRDDRDASVIIAVVGTWLRTQRNWLLVLDNVEEPQILEEFLPGGGDGHVLLTSRAQVFRDLGVSKPLVLEPMSPEEAREFLFASTDADAGDDLEVKAADGLASELGHLPLALEQAAALIAENHARFQEYLVSYRAQRASLLGEGQPRDYDHCVSTTWDMSFAAVEEISGAAADALRLSAFLSPDAIPLELISRGATECGERLAGALEGAAANPLLVHRTLEPLTRFSLIHLDPGSRSFTVHRLVQGVIADRMSAAEQALWTDRAVRAVNAAFPGFYPENKQLEEWALCGKLLPHAKAVTNDDMEDVELNLEQVGDVLDKISVYLICGGQFAAAEQVNRRCLGLRLRTCGAEDRRVGRCVHGLAMASHQQLQYGSAEVLYKRAIEIWEKACGPEHHQVAISLNNLAILYRQQRHHDAAERLLTRALQLSEQEFGPAHHRVTVVLGSLAVLELERGRRAQAEKLLRRSVAIRERMFGPNHHSLAPVLSNLATLVLDQGDLPSAESLIKRALTIRQNTFGPSHSEVALSLASMGKLHHRRREYPESEELYRSALEIFEKTIGLEHFTCVRVLELYSDLLLEVGRSTEAKPLSARAQAIRAKQMHVESTLAI